MRLLDGNPVVSHSQVRDGISRHEGDMAVASSKQRAVTDVPLEGWIRFGRILQDWREDELGYKTRAAFVRDRGINLRLAQELENSPPGRAGTYTKWALEDAGKAYQVTRESMLAVLHGEADALARAGDAPVRQPAAAGVRGLPPLPVIDPARLAADQPYMDRIQARLDLLRAQGNAAPSGAQLFPDSPADAADWDKYADWDLPLRTLFVADLQRRADGRGPGSAAGTAGA